MPSQDLIYRFLGLDAGAGASFDRMGAKTAALGKTSNAALASVKRLALGVGALGVVVGVESVKQAANYQAALTQLTTGAGETAKGLKYVHAALLRMAGPMGESATAMAKGMYLIESAGYHGAAGVKVLRAAIEGAKADGADIATVGDAVTTALNSYKLGAKQATAATNAMVAAVAIGKTHMQDLAASLGNVLPEAAALNVPLSQVLGAMATMTSQGTDAAKASQYLRFALSALANPTSKAQKELASLGLSTKALADATAQKGLTGAFLMLEDAVGNKFPKGSAAYNAAMSTIIGGTRGMQAALELTGRHLPTFQRDTQRVADAAKHAGKNVDGWGIYTKTMEHNLQSAESAINSLEIQLGEHLLPTATKALNWIATDGVRDLTKFGHFVERNKTLLEDLGGVLAATALAMKGITIGRGITGALGRSRSVLGTSVGAPIPVYVTNWQGGGGAGVPGTGVPGEKTTGTYGKYGRFGLAAVSTVAAAAATTNVIKNQLKLHDKSLTDRILNGIGSAMLFGSTSGELRSTKILPPIPADQITTMTKAEGHLKALGVVGVQYVQTQKQSADAAKQNVKQLQALNQLLVVSPGLTAAAGKAHDRLALSMQHVVGQAKIEAALLGHDLGQGLVAGIEAEIPHATMAGQILVAQTVKQMRLAAEARSPSKATYRLGGDLGQGLINGWTDKQVAKTLAHDLNSGFAQLANSVANARTRLGDALAAEHQFVQQGMTFAALSNVPTVDSGYTGNTTRLSNIGSFLHGQAKDYARFAKDLRRLSHIGLSKALVAQIAQMGPTQGIQYAQQILSGGGAGYAHQLDAYNKQISGSMKAIGREQYGPQVRADRREVKQQTRFLAEIARDIHEMKQDVGKGGVNVTVNGRQEKLTIHDAREIESILKKYKRVTGKG